jgi:hypothetical protein
MPVTSIVKKRIYKWKPFTGRPTGRPKSSWEDGVKNDLRKMKRMKWTEQVQDRLKWKVLLRGPILDQSCSAIEEEEVLRVIYRILSLSVKKTTRILALL